MQRAGAPFTTTVNATFALDGSASSDPEGLPLVFGWTQLSGTPVTLDNSAAMSPIFTAPALTGTLVFQLVVTDSAGLASAPAWLPLRPRSFSSSTLTTPVSRSPTPLTPTTGVNTALGMFSIARSLNIDSRSTHLLASHAYAPGVYTATLTATNAAGSAQVSSRVVVLWRLVLPFINR